MDGKKGEKVKLEKGKNAVSVRKLNGMVLGPSLKSPLESTSSTCETFLKIQRER